MKWRPRGPRSGRRISRRLPAGGVKEQLGPGSCGPVPEAGGRALSRWAAHAWLAAGSRPAPLASACPADPRALCPARTEQISCGPETPAEPPGGGARGHQAGTGRGGGGPWGSTAMLSVSPQEKEEGGRVQTPAGEPLWPVGPRLLSVSVCLSLFLCVCLCLSVPPSRLGIPRREFPG